MFEAVIRGLIWLALAVLLAFLAMWVLGELGIILPGIVIKIFGVILVLVAVLILYRIFAPHIGRFFP